MCPGHVHVTDIVKLTLLGSEVSVTVEPRLIKCGRGCRNNPEAYRNIVKRMLEASGRGMWKVSAEMQAKLQEEYGDIGDELEHVK